MSEKGIRQVCSESGIESISYLQHAGSVTPCFFGLHTRLAQISAGEIGLPEIDSSQVSSIEVSLGQIGAREIGTIQDCLAQIGFLEIGLPEITRLKFAC